MANLETSMARNIYNTLPTKRIYIEFNLRYSADDKLTK